MPSSPPLLALTTATDACGVALWQDGRLQAELTLHRPRRHAERLVPLIRDALAHSGVEARDLGAVAVASGPGSYTGLRIGASTAKGLVAATGAALVAVPTLAALAEAARPWAAPGDLVCPVLRSRRGEVYVAAFRRGEAESRARNGVFRNVFEAAALESSEAAARVQAAWGERAPGGAAWLVGPGAARVAGALPGSTDSGNANSADAHAGEEHQSLLRVVEEAAPTAGAVARLGAARQAAGTVEDAGAFEPRYLKDVHATPRRQSVFEGLS